MRSARTLSLLLGVSMLVLSPRQGFSDAPPKDAQSKKYADLVAQLVSPNKEPITGDESVRFPAGYDVKAQRRVDAARQALHDNFEDALPHLVAALDDPRYSMTVNWGEGDAYPNNSVGEVCRNVIASQLEIYRDKIRFSVPRWHQYNYPVSNAWWKTRKHRTRAELQVEAIDWAIERRKTEPEEERREEELAALRTLRDKIAKSGKPAKSNHMLRMVVSDKP